jgi:hypothetical protein
MTLPIVAIVRDAVVTEINGTFLPAYTPAFTPAVTAIAVYDYEVGLEKLVGARIVVSPRSKQEIIITRNGADQSELMIDVVVQAKLSPYPPPSNAAVDPFMNLAESIVTYFKRRILEITNMPNGAICLKAEWPHLFFEPHWRTLHTFTSVIGLQFTVNQ